MVDRLQLHEFVDRLPDSQVPAALAYLEFLTVDPVLLSLMRAPIDDEPEGEDDRRAAEEAWAAMVRGERLLTSDELAAELGL
jgi:hypothetical protein